MTKAERVRPSSPERTGANKNQVEKRPPRVWPIGAEIMPEGTHFRVWAPNSNLVKVALRNSEEFELVREGSGYHSGMIPEVSAGALYKLKLDHGSFADPVSRFQPDGPHGYSQIVDSRAFNWTDQNWRGLPKTGHVIYEMHVGTFTQEGDWLSAADRLSYLEELGVTIIEIMPVCDFPGNRGWGYDGVNFFAPTRLYGSPDEFRKFVDSAHAHGIGVILDVVYNHVGPDGNFLREFSHDYFTNKHKNEWGAALNFDEKNNAPVREFFTTNAAYWIAEYHLDGLRLDATQAIQDSSPTHIIAEISAAVRQAAAGRETWIVAENDPQQAQLVRPLGKGGYGLDAIWNDDFHHASIVALTGKREAYYAGYNGNPQEFISAAKWGFLYQGQRNSWQKHGRGAPAFDLSPENFVHFIQNHDQIANSLRGHRIHALTSPGSLRVMTALLLLGPAIPMLFQGQEFAASTPFLYFADHNPELAVLVAKGRARFLEQFPSIKHAEARQLLHSPELEETFLKCKLNFEDIEKNRAIFDLHRDLIALRHSDPVIGHSQRGAVDGAIIAPDIFLLRYFGGNGNDRLAMFNFGSQFTYDASPEPLVAAPENHIWKQVWTSETVRYAGEGMDPLLHGKTWLLPARAAVLLRGEPSQSQE